MRSHQSKSCSPDFGRAVTDYLTHLTAGGRSPATVESYSSTLRALGSALSGNVMLSAISAHRLDVAVTALCRPAARGSCERSQATLNRYRSTFRVFFRWAFETGRLPSNPAAALRLASAESTPTPPIRPEETRRFLAAIRRSGDPLRVRDEALFALYALTGLRRAEALTLDSSDYDAEEKSIRVRNGKGRRPRTVPVVTVLAAVLDEYRRRFPAQGGKLFPGRDPGEGLTPRQAHTRFQLWKAAADLRAELSIHSFRVGFATAIHEASSDFAMVSRALGHRDFRSTLRYLAPDRNKLVQAIEATLAGVLCCDR
jgi:site-specific recombinase XerC